MFDVDTIGLPKWPALVVVGEPITEDQAAEIILKTSSLFFSSNDKEFCAQLYESMGVETNDHGWPDFDKLREIRKSIGGLSLEYLGNQRIVSSWVGGPHGWCSWNGRIGSANYNIGKYPSASGILDEWKTVAKSFPYLKLGAQLFSGETCELDAKPVVEYTVKDGNAFASDPQGLIGQPENFNPNLIHLLAGTSTWERGCTVEKFTAALKITKKSRM